MSARLENSISCRQDLENSISCQQDLQNSISCRQDWKIQYLVGRIWKIQDLAGRIWKIQYIVGKIWKIQYLATHHLLPRCSNSRRITHQLATPFLAGVTFFSFCFYPYLKRIKVLDIRTCQRQRIAPPPPPPPTHPPTGRYSHKFRIGLCRPGSFKNLDDPNLPP